MKISEYVNYNKPRERAKTNGFSSLTDEELLALIIRSGNVNMSVLDIARSILNDVKDIAKLRTYSINDLNNFVGMGDAKSTSLLAAIELANRINKKFVLEDKYKIMSPNDIFCYLSNFHFNVSQEEFYIICLNVRKEVINSKLLFIGTIDSTIVHPRDIFKFALSNSASYVIFAHNHPSRDLTPSTEDICVTNKLVECGNLLNIKVLDHIIFSDIDYYSFREDDQM